MTRLDYELVDADNHYYEPDDCFTRHIAPAFRDKAIRVVRTDGDPLGRVFIGEKRAQFAPITPHDNLGPPGQLQAYFRGEAERGAFTENPVDTRTIAEFRDRDARLALLDKQGIELAIMLPTFGITMEEDLADDPDATYANLEAFNRWLAEDWGFGNDGRMLGVPLTSLIDPDRGVAELERVLNEGARMIHLRPGPVKGKSPADPTFDRFWSLVEEADIPVVFHIGDSSYPGFFVTQWGETPRPLHRLSAFQRLTCHGERPIADTVAALVLHNLFGRHPKVRIVSIENGSAWLPRLLKNMDKVAGITRNDDWPFGAPPAKPTDVVRRHVWVAPFYEEDVNGLIDTIGAERVLFGSDYPHPEGLAEPIEFLDSLAGQSDAVVRRVMRDNTRELLGMS